MRSVAGLLGGANPVPGLSSLLPGAGTVGMAASVLSLLGGMNAKPEVHLHQEVVINIGEGQVSERAFWDDLVQYHILPGLTRGGLVAGSKGGAE